MEISQITTAFLLGLMGAGHCFAMCGGIISTLSVSTDSQSNKKSWRLITLYQIGRISSYTLFGAIAGLIGFQIDELTSLPILKIISSLLLILTSLYISRIWMALSYLEKAGKVIWDKISPLSKNLLPVKSNKQALFLGTLWGWLPCGLVYSSLGYALTLSTTISSAGFMFVFGIGTLPATLLAGGASATAKKFLNHSWVRYSVATAFFAFGIYTMYQIFGTSVTHHHH